MTSAPVSVLIATFNSAKYVREAIDSVASQTVKVEEIIVIDDGSTDETPELIGNDPRIRYVRCANGGVSAARNVGLALAKGEFVAFLDADDRWLPEMVASQVELLRANPQLAGSFTNMVRFEEASNRRLPEQFSYYPELQRMRRNAGGVPNGYVIEGDAFDALVSMGEIPGFTQVLMFRRAAIQGFEFDTSLRICEDMKFVLRVFMGKRIGYVTTVLAEIRRHGGNATMAVEEMGIFKLHALRSLARHVPAASLPGYRDRMIRAYVGAAVACCHLGRIREAVHYAGSMLMAPGSWLRKLKGAARICTALLRLA
jgi:glycosyltransferase involved in cell wall biosynthesis